jgi:hypothetical protein
MNNENCAKCNKPMDRYYGFWCKVCDAPQVKLRPTIGHTGIKDRVWEYYQDSIKNDTSFTAHFDDDNCMPDDIRVIKEYITKSFGHLDCVTFEVSW